MDWAPDAVLLDLMLLDDNGYRVCETLRQRDETVPIIPTAKAQESDKIRGLDAAPTTTSQAFWSPS
jgi:DNA-binding response OmpR family regulator